ncbi:MAG: hypothetical protein IPK83_13915 [Planctomycetes bacterium]|nr:hypothetical protein [Planctomycetota bacterium]
MNISIVYTPNSKDEKQQQYIEQLIEYCDELRTVSRQVSYKHIATAREREELAARINKTFGSEADKHQTALQSFEAMRSKLQSDLQRLSVESDTLLSQESWLSDFPLFAQIALKIRDVEKSLTEAADEIKALTPEGGIPKFAEATTQAKTATEEISKTLEAVGKLTSELTRLADEVTKSDSANIKMLREAAAMAKSQVEILRNAVGNDGDPMPADAATALKNYADAGVQVGMALDGIVKKIDEFAKQFPIVRQHANWAARVQNGPLVMQLEVADVLHEVGEGLRKTRLQLLGIIDGKEPGQIEQALKATRTDTGRLEKNASVCEQLLTELAIRLSNLDDPSSKFLAAARDNGLFRSQSEGVAKVEAELKDLPELKLGSVADKLSEENSVVIEVNKKIRVVDFASVWPVRESIPVGDADKKEEQRTFNGDSSISSAILALKADKPFAAVTFVSFEPPAPQQRNPFMPPPPQSSVPTAQLSELRTRLEAANFKVYDWNLATTKERPKIDEGQTDLLLLLPPAPPSPPNPFNQQAEEVVFGEEHRKIVRDLLEGGASALFVGCWEVAPAGFGTRQFATPPYGYQPILENDWGLKLDNSTRILAVEADRSTANGFTVGVLKFNYMPLTGFTDQPIGKPMIGTRFLVTDCAQVVRKGDEKRNIKVESVVSIPKREEYIAVNIDDLIEIINRINDKRSGGVVQMEKPTTKGPFDVMMTATRTPEDGKPKSRIAVMGFGASIKDSYVKSPILADTNRARFDEAPAESLDLVVNSLYWLNDTEGYIGRGPVPVPRVRGLSDSELLWTKSLVWLIWRGWSYCAASFRG